MSAFLVNPYHINALVSWAAFKAGPNIVSYYWGGRRRNIRGDEARIASVLYAENVRSVNARYNECDPAHGFRFKCEPQACYLKPGQILGALHCLEYQSCESSDWRESEAFAIVRGIEYAAIRMVDGYDGAWELRKPAPAKNGS